MDKTNRTELRRIFLIGELPEPLTRASSHIQIFDNYIADTRMRLRSIRNPDDGSWTRILQQRFAPNANDLSALKIAEIYLNEGEYQQFQVFEGDEIRKNRYFHEFDGWMFSFDVYLGEHWGLNISTIEFETEAEWAAFEIPQFAVFEVTNNPVFLGDNLAHKTLADIRAEVAKIGEAVLPAHETFAE